MHRSSFGPPPVPVRLQQERRQGEGLQWKTTTQIQQEQLQLHLQQQQQQQGTSPKAHETVGIRRRPEPPFITPTRPDPRGAPPPNYLQQRKPPSPPYGHQDGPLPQPIAPNVDMRLRMQAQNQEMMHDALEERFRAMEVRIAALESEKCQDEARIRDLTASLAETKARSGSAHVNQVESHASERVHKLEASLQEMSKHVGSLEDLLIDRDDRIKKLAHDHRALASRLDQASAAAASVDDETSAKTTHLVGGLAAELSKQRQSLESLQGRVDDVARRLQQGLAGAEAQTSKNAEKVAAVAVHVRRGEDALAEWKTNLARQIESQESGLAQMHKTLDAQASRENQMQSLHQAALDDLRETLTRHTEKTNERLEKHARDLRERLASEMEAGRQAQAGTRSRFSEDLARFKESFDLDRRNLDVRMQKIFEEFVARSSSDDARIADMRAELENRLSVLTEDLRHEESVRLDAIRRVHDEVVEQVEALQDRVGQGLHVGGAGIGAASGGGEPGGPSTAEKLADLEEVVRAEVRARMRHEAKAREHVANTAQTLQVQIDKYRRSTHEAHDSLRRQVDAQAAALKSKVQQDVQHVSDKLAEFAQARQLTNAEALERVSLCEAKLAKRTAAQQIEVDRVRADLEQIDEARRGDLARLEGALGSAQTHFETHVAQSMQALHVQVQEMQTAWRHDIKTHAAEMATQLHDIAHRAQIVNDQHQKTFEEHRKLLEDAVSDLGTSIERVAASQASKEALGTILDDIEKRELRERQEAAERAKEEQLRAELQQGLAELEQTFSQFYEDVESKANALEGLVHESQQSSYQYMDALRVQIEAEGEQRAADQSTVRLAVDQLCSKMDHMEAGALRQTQEDTAGLQVALVLEGLLAGVAEQALEEEQDMISDAAASIYTSIEALSDQVASCSSVSAQVDAKVNVLQNTIKLVQEEQEQKPPAAAAPQVDREVLLSRPASPGPAGRPDLLTKPSRDSIVIDDQLDLAQSPEADLGSEVDENDFAL